MRTLWKSRKVRIFILTCAMAITADLLGASQATVLGIFGTGATLIHGIAKEDAAEKSARTQVLSEREGAK